MWRWHFYAGVAVLPFLFVLALSGLAMLAAEPIDRHLQAHLREVAASGAHRSATELQAVAAAARPHSQVVTFLPPARPTASAQFTVVPHAASGDHGGHGATESRTVFVNPYTGAVLGDIDPNATLYLLAKKVHGTLLLGAAGDYAIEIAAGFGVLLVVTGLYLWWPRGPRALRRALWPDLSTPGRKRWRDLHGAAAAWVSPLLLFFLISGLAWTPFWGGSLVQAWSSVPAESFDAPQDDATHAALGHGAGHEVPWAIEQTPLPQSGASGGVPGIAASGAVTLDDVVEYARGEGFTRFRVHLPRDEQGVFTIAATAIAGDLTDPRADRIVHLDARTGNVVGQIGFADYSPMGKFMAAGIPLHQADTGVPNLAVNVLFCLLVIGLGVAAIAAWWARRPRGALRLAPPPLPRDTKLWHGAVVVMLVASLAFPLAAATIAIVLALDLLVLSRVEPVKRVLQ